MFEPSLLFAMIFSLVSGGVYFYVGNSLSRRRIVSPDARHAWTLFVVWWYALAGATLAEGTITLLGILGVTGLPLILAITQVEFLAICVGLYGLIYYLMYLFTGSRKMQAPLMAFYIAFYFLLMYFVDLNTPTSVTIGRWGMQLEYQKDPPVLFALLVVALLTLPQIICGIAYFTLYFQVKETGQKYRVALVSWSIMIWFMVALLSVLGLSKYDWWQVFSRLVGLSAALMILMAYQPVNWIKKRLGVSAITEENN